MNNPYAGVWLGMGVLAALPLVFYVRRAYLTHRQRRQEDAPPPAYNPASIISWSILLGSITALSFAIRPAPFPLHLVQVLAFGYMYVLQYAVNVWLTDNTPYRLRQSRLVYVTLAASLIIVLLAYRSRTNYGHIFTADPVRPTLLYGTYYGLGLLVNLVAQLLIIRLYVRSIVNTTDVTYRVRRSIGLFAMVCVGVGTVSALLNTIVFVRYGDTYRRAFNLVFYSTIPMIVIIPFVNAVPQTTLTRWAAPLVRRHLRRAQRDHAWLRTLHGQLVTIAPRVALRHAALLDERLLVELTHARQVIWSYTPRTRPVSAKTEATHIWALLRNGNVIKQSGPYEAPHPWRRSERRHLVAIARHLARLNTRPTLGGDE